MRLIKQAVPVALPYFNLSQLIITYANPRQIVK